jgi:hypothetical protein
MAAITSNNTSAAGFKSAFVFLAGLVVIYRCLISFLALEIVYQSQDKNNRQEPHG